MKKFLLELVALICGFLMTMGVAIADFKDVASSHHYYEAVNYVQTENIVSGYPDGSYKPDQTINRAGFTKIIVNVFFSKEVDKAYLCHVAYAEDVTACDGTDKCEAAAFVNYGACMGYATDKDGNPNPASEILRLYDACFPDVPEGAWYKKFICHAKMKGMIGGYPDGTFKPEQEVSFAEAAKILANAFGYSVTVDGKVWYKPYVDALSIRKAIPVLITRFEQKITRGDMAEMVYRLKASITDRDSQSYEALR